MTELQYELKFRTAVSTFSGLATAGLVDRMAVRDSKGLPCISGSSVKGRWRFFAERLLRARGLPAGLWIHDSNGPLCKDSPCTLCKLFGSPAIPAMLQVGQAELDASLKSLFKRLLDSNPNPVIHPDAEIRPGTCLSRVRRTTLPAHLFFEEAIPPVTFCGQLIITGTITPVENEFLHASGRLVDRIGGRKAVGRGILDKGIEITGAAE
jgi:CRISPR/Cas system CSM-associated protein Csm3 (group 7 of RAMP superfamily)